MNDQTPKDVPVSTRIVAILSFLGLLLALLVAAPAAADPVGTATTSGGLELRVEITDPADGATVATDSIQVSGTARTVAGADARVVAVMDLSLSTQYFEDDLSRPESGDCDGDGVVGPADDVNDDGFEGSTLDCEALAVAQLFQQISSSEGQARGAVVGFGQTGFVADAQPAAGHQRLTGLQDDLDADATADLAQVAASAYSRDNGSIGFELFDPVSGTSATNFERALEAALQVFDDQAGGSRVVYFFTDGEDNSGFDADSSPALQQAVDTGTTITTFSVGEDATGCADGGSPTDVGAIAAATGGRCIEVQDATDLPALTLQSASVESLSSSLNGGPEQPIAASGQWTTTVDGLVEGANTVAVTATASDGTTAVADIEVIYDPAAQPSSGQLGAPGVTRIDGDGDVRQTAIDTCQAVRPDGDSAARVLVSRDDAFADALAGSSLLNFDSCILFTEGGPGAPLDPRVRTEIDRVLGDGGEIGLLGGANAVSDLVESELVGAGYDVTRYAGPTRYETAVAIAQRAAIQQDVAPFRDVILANGEDWPDAITSGAYAAIFGTPVVLTQRDTLHPETAQFMANQNFDHTWVVGGQAVIADAVAQQTSNPQRVAGPNRMATARAVADEMWGDLASGEDFIFVNLEHPQGWILALSAAPVAVHLSAPELGVRTTSLPAETQQYLDEQGFPDLPSATLMGDLTFISATVEEEIEQAIQPSGSGSDGSGGTGASATPFAYTADGQAVRYVTADGSEVEIAVGNTWWTPTWSPDGTTMAYVTGDGQPEPGGVDYAGDLVLATVDAAGTVVDTTTFDVSPDAYAVRARSGVVTRWPTDRVPAGP